MWIAYLHATLLLALEIVATSYDFGQDIPRLTRRQDEGRILVGALPRAANGSVPYRLDIRQMRDDRYQWDLFILALSMFQALDQDDPHSWYQIAGIHGVPFQTWNGVEPVKGGSNSGYCTHSSVLFPTWHRPYLALVEQEIFHLATLIAGMFSSPFERRRYQQAALTIRLPYWDWALGPPPNETHFPDVFWHPTIQQYGPRDIQTIRNPLYSYVFNPVHADAFIWTPINSWPETKRAPNYSISSASPPSMNADVNQALLEKLPEVQERLFMLFSRIKDFNSFGNKAWGVAQNLSIYDSIEAIHDVIHIYSGLRGHMNYVPLSSFDPFFFIHHASVDRYFAMWQMLNPDAWIAPMAAGETSYNTVAGEVQDSQTPLTPFYITPTMFWRSDWVRDPAIFGYTYADVDVSAGPPAKVKDALTRKIRNWYGGSSVVALQRKISVAPQRLAGFSGFKDIHTGADSNGGIPLGASIIKNGHYNEWVTNVHVNVEALDGRYSIHFFFEKRQSGCRGWEKGPSDIGTVDIFAMNRTTGSQSKISAALPLTSALIGLVADGEIPNLDTVSVEPLLRTKLGFLICSSESAEVDPSLVDGLHISVSSTDVEIPATSAELPRWGVSARRLQLWP